MNVYDFDGTIYDGDSTIDFYKFCLMRYPKVVFALPRTAYGFLLFIFGKINRTAFKEYFFNFLRLVPNIDGVVTEFWMTRGRKIKPWYLSQKQDDDVIISASPEFLLAPVCANLGVVHIASRVDKYSGKFYGLNCRYEEKVKRFRESYGDTEIDCFYSDSQLDKPLAELAKEAFLVTGDKIVRWANG